MAIPGYMTILDDQGSAIEGPVKVAGREGTVEILGFDHELRIPTDSDTGSLTGTRKHEPFVFLKAFDNATPYLYKSVQQRTNPEKDRAQVVSHQRYRSRRGVFLPYTGKRQNHVGETDHAQCQGFGQGALSAP